MSDEYEIPKTEKKDDVDEVKLKKEQEMSAEELAGLMGMTVNEITATRAETKKTIEVDKEEHTEEKTESDKNDEKKQSVNKDNTDTSENSSADDNEKSQTKKITEAEIAKKGPPPKENRGFFLDRNKLAMIILFFSIVFFLFFTVLLPMFKVEKKKSNDGFSQRGSNYIPSDLLGANPDNPIEDGNSSLSNSDDDEGSNIDDIMGQKFPDPTQPANKAPVVVPQNGNAIEIPLTNRNEQQKSISRVSIDLRKNQTYGTSNPSANSSSRFPREYPAGYEKYTQGENTGNMMTAGYSTASGRSYTPTALSSNIENFIRSQTGANDSYSIQNNQADKRQFYSEGQGTGGNYVFNDENALWKGTVISAVLDTAINTDLPGEVMAHVSKNVYSSKDGKWLLIPEGSRLFGEYNSEVTYGQNRVQVVWNTLIRPDGLEINLGSMNGIDAYGHSGYSAFHTNHPFQYMKAFGLIALYSIVNTKMENSLNGNNNQYAQNVMADTYSATKNLENKILDRALNIQPTNRIASGTKINLITNVTMDLPVLDPYPVEEKYVRY